MPSLATRSRAFVVKVRGKNPEHAVFTPDGRYVFVSAEDGQAVDVIDVAQRAQVAQIPVGVRPRGIGFSPDSTRAYVAAETSNELYVIDARTFVVLARIPGFCSFRLLQDGDIIVGVVEQPDEPIDSPRDLIMAVTKVAAGQTLTFEVLRRAELVRIPITLDAKPDFNVQIPDLNAFENNRAQTAEQVWNTEFAPLLKDSETVG